MFLSNFSIRQPVTTVAMVIVLMCLGLLAFKNLRVNQNPDVQQPVIVVTVPYPGDTYWRISQFLMPNHGRNH